MGRRLWDPARHQDPLGEDRADSPDGHEDADCHQEPGSTGAEDSFYAGRLFASPILDHGQAIADEQGEADAEDQLGKDLIEADDVTHEADNRSPVSLR